MSELIFILLCVDNNVQHLLDALSSSCQIHELIVNVEKTKMMAIKTIQPRHRPTFIDKGEPIQVVQSFIYLCINVPSTNRWNVYYESRLQGVGIVIIAFRINATKVVLKDEK